MKILTLKAEIAHKSLHSESVNDARKLYEIKIQSSLWSPSNSQILHIGTKTAANSLHTTVLGQFECRTVKNLPADDRLSKKPHMFVADSSAM